MQAYLVYKLFHLMIVFPLVCFLPETEKVKMHKMLHIITSRSVCPVSNFRTLHVIIIILIMK